MYCYSEVTRGIRRKNKHKLSHALSPEVGKLLALETGLYTGSSMSVN
jgi:hypothetical protein